MKVTAPGAASPSRTAVRGKQPARPVTAGNKSLCKCSTAVLIIPPPEFSLHNPLPLVPLYQSPLPSLNFIRCLASPTVLAIGAHHRLSVGPIGLQFRFWIVLLWLLPLPHGNHFPSSNANSLIILINMNWPHSQSLLNIFHTFIVWTINLAVTLVSLLICTVYSLIPQALCQLSARERETQNEDKNPRYWGARCLVVDDEERVIKPCDMSWKRNINKEQWAGSGENGDVWAGLGGWVSPGLPMGGDGEMSHIETRWKRVERPYQAAKIAIRENTVINSSNCLEFHKFRANPMWGTSQLTSACQPNLV